MPTSHAAVKVAAVAIGIYLIVPTMIVIPMGFTGIRSFVFPPPSWSTQWYENLLTDQSWRTALTNTAVIAMIVTLVATALGTAAAYGLWRAGGHFRTPAIGAFGIPMVVPVVIGAVAIYALFLPRGLAGNTLGFVLAHTAIALPFVVVSVSASLQGFDRRLEWASASLGASPVRTARSVTLPVVAPGIVTGAAFAFVASFDEVVISLFLATPDTRTLPVKMFSSVIDGIDPTVAAASTLLFLGSTAILLLVALGGQNRKTR